MGRDIEISSLGMGMVPILFSFYSCLLIRHGNTSFIVLWTITTIGYCSLRSEHMRSDCGKMIQGCINPFARGDFAWIYACYCERVNSNDYCTVYQFYCQ